MARKLTNRMVRKDLAITIITFFRTVFEVMRVSPVTMLKLSLIISKKDTTDLFL